MRLLRNVIIFILFFSSVKVFAHEDFTAVRKYSNVIVRLKSGYSYEEFNKVFLLGKLVEKFSRKLNYSQTIFLDFDHYYVGQCQPAYFISFDKGKDHIKKVYADGEPEKDILKDNAIVIRQVSTSFDPQITLKLVEYAIENLPYIKRNQKTVVYKENYCDWEIKSVDRKRISQIVNAPSSKNVRNSLTERINLDDDKSTSISYYLQNNSFTLFYKSKGKESKIITLKTIYYIAQISKEAIIVFTSKSSFYYINKSKLSKKQYIPNPKTAFRPYNIEKYKNDTISFFYYYTVLTGNKDKPMKDVKREYVYSITKDKLTLKNTTGNNDFELVGLQCVMEGTGLERLCPYYTFSFLNLRYICNHQ
ncbi:hypothetical protein [Flavobacterium pedocola]